MAVKSLKNSGIRNFKDYSGSMNAGLTSYDMDHIETVLISANTGSVTFSNIPQEYKHIQVRLVAKATSSVNDAWVRLNGSFNGNTTDSNYAIHQLYGTGSGISGYYETSSRKGFGIATRSSSVAYGVSIIDILDYTSTNKNKTARCTFGEHGSSTGSSNTVGVLSELWLNTAAITQIGITTEDGSSFIAGSRFSLYGIRG